MDLHFVFDTYKSGKRTSRKSLYSWRGLTPKMARIASINFYDGFCAAFSKDFRRPVNPFSDGLEIWSWNFHHDQSGWIYRFIDGRGRVVRFK